MGNPYCIVCDDCEKKLTIGEKRLTGDALFSSDSDVMEKLRLFLFEHELHLLTFLSFDVEHVLDYKE